MNDETSDRLRHRHECLRPHDLSAIRNSLGRLSTPEIAKAFLTPESTLAQRIVRARQKIQQARIPYEVPPPERMQERLASLQAVLYLIFNEGYSASSGNGLVRSDLCAEAIRLSRTIHGELVTLEDQDRTLWDRAAIDEGLQLVERSLRIGPDTLILFDPLSQDEFRKTFGVDRYPSHVLCLRWIGFNTIRKQCAVSQKQLYEPCNLWRRIHPRQLQSNCRPPIEVRTNRSMWRALRLWRSMYSTDGVTPPASFQAVKNVVAFSIDKVRSATIDPEITYTNEFVTAKP